MGFYFSTGHTGRGSDSGPTHRHICKVHTQGIAEGGSCGGGPNLHFAIHSGAFFSQLGARCSPVPAPFSIPWANWVTLAVIPLHPHSQIAEKYRDVLPLALKKTTAQGTAAQGGERNCSLYTISVSAVQFWLQLHQQPLFL